MRIHIQTSLFLTLMLFMPLKSNATTPPSTFAFVEMMDINADGYSDVFVSTNYASGVGIMLGDGLGGFGNGVVDVYSVGTRVGGLRLTGSKTAADPYTFLYVNLGYPVHWSKLSLSTQAPYLRQVDANASSISQPTLTVDMNADSYADLIYNNLGSITLELGNGNGTYASPQVLFVAPYSPLLDVSDANGDGNADILFEADYNHFVIYYGDGLGGFTAGPLHLGGAQKFIDINHDVYADVISIQNSRYALEFILGDAAQSFNNRIASQIGGNSYSSPAFVSNLNADVYADFFLTRNGFLTAYIGDGTGYFSTYQAYDIVGTLPFIPFPSILPLQICADGTASPCTVTPSPSSCLVMTTSRGGISLGLFIFVLVLFKHKRFQTSL